MKAMRDIKVYFAAALATCLLLGQAAYAGVAGHVQFVNGDVQITNTAGQARTMQKGDAVHESDTVATEKNGSAQIKMRDGGLIAVRPDSQLKFDSFVFMGKEDGKDRSFFSLMKGGFRAITGLIGQRNKSNYRVVTAAATIGIRGTDHEIYVVAPGSELAARVPVGTYNKVNTGGTTLTTNKGAVNIQPNQMGFAASADHMPLLQPVNANIFTSVPPAMQTSGGQSVEAEGRESAVVDSAVQESNQAAGNVVPKTTTLRPITEEQNRPNQTIQPRVF